MKLLEGLSQNEGLRGKRNKDANIYIYIYIHKDIFLRIKCMVSLFVVVFGSVFELVYS